MSKPTPGPWHLGATSMNPHLMTVVGANGAIVAEPHIGDARLIAAAPNLLEALRALLVACLLADHKEELAAEVDGSLLDAADAAIAKAEGRA